MFRSVQQTLVGEECEPYNDGCEGDYYNMASDLIFEI